MIKNCLRCKKEYKSHPSDNKKYCSLKCFHPPIYKACLICDNKIRTRPARIKNGRGKYCSRRCRGLANRGIRWGIKGYFKKGFIPWNKGKEFLAIRGINNVNWKGGVTSKAEKIRKSLKYKEWRESVFKRDNYICQFCGKRGGELNADHIKPFSLYPELRLSVENGRTLCLPCHKLTPSYLKFTPKNMVH